MRWMIPILGGALALVGCDDGSEPLPAADGALASAPEPEPEPEPDPDPDPEPEPDAAPEPEADPWPDPLPPPAPGLAAVYDGRALAAGETLRIPGPPAGLDHPLRIELTLVWRGADPIQFDAPHADWLDAPGFTWLDPPPMTLDPDVAATIALRFDPRIAAEAGVHAARLTAPGADFALDLEVALRRPLRLVIVGGGGEALISDAYGLDLRPAGDAMPPTARHTVTWGAGRFFRSWATGGEWADPGAYAYSDDGVEWTPASAAPEFWASGCVWGGDRFTCAVGDRAAWSENGSGVVHEATRWQGMLHAIAAGHDQIVAVGRGGRRVVSVDGVGWAHDSGDGGLPDGVDDDWFFGITARPEGGWIAVGGQNSTITAYSDDGVEWAVERDPASRGSGSVACVPGRCLRSNNGGESPLYASADGRTWAPVELADPQSHHLLGVVDGWFVAAVNPWQQPGSIFRSRDGVEWTLLHAAETHTHWVGMALEGWAPDR